MNSSDVRQGHGVEELSERSILLANKTHIPVVRDQLIKRPAALNRLLTGQHHKLTLVSAPAGWGKTTLLAQSVQEAGDSPEDQRFAWLSLDSSDNDPVWFWMYVVAALQKAIPDFGTRAVEHLVMGAEALQVALPTLLNDFDSIADQVILILDDYHTVANEAIHEQMEFVIGRIPANFHVVIATRSDPALPLARLRANGDLAEVRVDDLRFDADEAQRLFNDILRLDLTDADVERLHRRTEGWAAGLYLAALSLSGRTDTAALIETFAGDNRYIVDYLMAEVLDKQPPHMRDFLLHTSVLGRLSGELCDAVLQRADSAAILEEIESENLFLVPLDMRRRWYRYHHLFGELLRSELQRDESHIVPELHRRAGVWFEGEGLVDEAVRHFVIAGDVPRSADLIATDWVEEFNGGGLSTVSGWLDLLPGRTVWEDPRLSAIRAWIALNAGQFDDSLAWIEAVEAGLTSGTSDHHSLQAQLVALREVHAFKTGQLTAALEAARHAMTLNFEHAPQALSATYCIYGSALYFSGCPEEADAIYRKAIQWAEKIGDRRRRIYALGWRALIATEAGQLTEAERHIGQATGAGTALTGGEHFVNAMVSLAAATSLQVRGDLAGSADAAYLAVALARKGAGILEVAKALLFEAEIREYLGELDVADARRQEADGLLEDCPTEVADALISARLSHGKPMRHKSGRLTSGDELTDKELELLRLLATRLSPREISQRLVVSFNTIKTHQRAIYRKLGVRDRGTAVTRAKELGLL